MTAKRSRRIARAVLLALLLAALLLPLGALADSPTDEILVYRIRADVNEDATVTLDYHIEWKVLVSDGIGPLSWVTVGIPNADYVSYEALSDTIRSISYSTSSGVTAMRIDFDRDYYKGEVVSFDFEVVQDSMYQMNCLTDGETLFAFTPGWFDGIEVDEFTLQWNADKAVSWTPDCLMKDGCCTWTQSLRPGEIITVNISYPNDAYSFNIDKSIGSPVSDYDDYDSGSSASDVFASIIGGLFWVVVIGIGVVNKIAKLEYRKGSGFGAPATKKKITRTKITYYPVCEGCGAPRGEGEQFCTHCGRSYIKSEEKIEEENVQDEDKEAIKYKKNGEYRYSSSPNTYVRVNVVNIPVPRATTTRSSSSYRGGSSGRGGGGGGSRGGGCAHSSCACACASCACACACACAGGGRAGCTTKDFYKTDLKLRQLELKRRK